MVAAKLTGAGRWHDTLSFRDAGADHTFDFVDAGLPTTNTKAGVALVHELAGLAALDLLDVGTHGSLRQRLEAAVGSRG